MLRLLFNYMSIVDPGAKVLKFGLVHGKYEKGLTEKYVVFNTIYPKFHHPNEYRG